MIALAFLLAVQQYDHGNPTPEEQLVLEIINRARGNVAAEETRLKSTYGLPLGWTLSEGLAAGSPAVINKPPLAFNATLLGIARTHSKDMHDRAFFAHINPDGKDPFERMADAGYAFNKAGENIAARSPLGSGPPLLMEDDLMVDPGVTDRGHRVNLLDIMSSAPYREIGIGYWSQTAVGGGWDHLLTQDFGRDNLTGPFITGVVYIDRNGNGFYDVGEGIGGVTITVTGTTAFAVTSFSGGYAIPFPGLSGAQTVTATSANSLPSAMTGTPTLGSSNIKVDFIVVAADGDGDGLPDYWEARFPTATTAGGNPDADSKSNLEEFQGGSDPTDNASLPVATPPPPAPPPPPPAGTGGGGGGGGGGGACGMTGLDGFLLLTAAAFLRRRRN